MTSSAPRRRAALLDHHSPRGRASARRTARGRLAGRRFRLLYRPAGAEAAQPRRQPARGGDDRAHANGWDSGKDVVVEVRPCESRTRRRSGRWPPHGSPSTATTGIEVRGQEFVELSDSGGNTEEALGSTGSRPPRSSPSATSTARRRTALSLRPGCVCGARSGARTGRGCHTAPSTSAAGGDVGGRTSARRRTANARSGGAFGGDLHR